MTTILGSTDLALGLISVKLSLVFGTHFLTCFPHRHPHFLSVPPEMQAYSHLRVFVQTSPQLLSYPQSAHGRHLMPVLHSSLCLKVTFS